MTMNMFGVKIGPNAMGWGIAMGALALAGELIKDYNANKQLTMDGAVRGTLAATATGVSTAIGTQVFNNMSAKMQRAAGIAFIASFLAGVFSNPEPKVAAAQHQQHPEAVVVDAEVVVG